jgi:hypothetical protein
MGPPLVAKERTCTKRGGVPRVVWRARFPQTQMGRISFNFTFWVRVDGPCSQNVWRYLGFIITEYN